jgi:hypothetical protein
VQLLAPAITAVCWDGMRALDLVMRTRRVDTWEHLSQEDRDELIARVELYMDGASAEETYTAQRDACLDAGVELDPSAVPWDELPTGLRERGNLMYALVQTLVKELGE